jgi:benzylsuccinate CoA-transferase BbsF subunit/naphthyl-2-methylsuccinate CoA transferase subunit
MQGAGVPAGPVQDDGECFRCPHLAERGFFQEQTREDIGTFRYPGLLFQWKDTPNQFRRGPVRLGEDNEYLYRTLLGVSDDVYRGLIESGEAGTTYPESILRPGGS